MLEIKRNKVIQQMSMTVILYSFFNEFNVDTNEEKPVQKKNNVDMDWFGDFGKT